MRSFILAILSMFLLVSNVSATTYFVDFGGGSDSNNGTSTSSAWQHVRGMTGCANICLSTNIIDGDIIKFRGGVTWTASYPWTLRTGTAAMVTYTTDHTWFIGGAFTQPVFDDQGAHPGPIGMINTGSGAGFFTMNDLKFFRCGVLGDGISQDKCLVFPNAHDITFTNNTFLTYAWIDTYVALTTPASYSNFIFTDNDVSHTGSMFWLGIASSTGGVNVHNVQILRNVGHDISSQLGGDPNISTDGIHGNVLFHYFGSGAHGIYGPHADPTEYVDGVVVCNNRTYGDFRNVVDNSGIANTSFFYFEGSVSGLFCNNDLGFSPIQVSMFNAPIYVDFYGNTHGGTLEIYNNSVVQPAGVNTMSGGIHIRGAPSTQTIILKNNLVSAMHYPIDFETSTTATITADYNLLNSTDGHLWYDGSQTYAVWQAAGRDTPHSILGSDPLVIDGSSNLHLQNGSPAIAAAQNLSGLGYTILNSDRDGVARGSSWDGGAYQQQGGAGAPAAPTGIHVVGTTTNTLVSLAWNDNAESNIAGYRVYTGTSTGLTTSLVKTSTPTSAASTLAPVTQSILSFPVAATYYFTVTAFNTSNQESTKSSEISVVLTGQSTRSTSTTRSTATARTTR